VFVSSFSLLSRGSFAAVRQEIYLSDCPNLPSHLCDVLIVESEHDDIIPHPAIANYLAAFGKAHSLTYRVIESADHALSEERWQQAYTSLLVNWTTEMVLGAREGNPGTSRHARG
jgi:dienelactone hydrolase